MSLSASKVISDLAKVRSTTTKGQDVEIHGMFCFRNSKVMTFDGVSGSVANCELEGMEFLVNAAKFWSVLDALPNDAFTIDQTEGWILVRSGAFSVKLPTQEVFDFPDILPKNSTIYLQAGDVVSALKEVLFTVEKDESQQTTGVGFRGSHVYSLDGKRITRASIGAEVSKPVVISKRAADILARAGTPTYLFLAGTSLGATYKDEKRIFLTRMLNTQMPFDHLDLAFEQPSTVSEVVPSEFLKVLERVMLLADKEESRITLISDGHQMTVATKEQELGSANDTLMLGIGHPFQIYVKGANLRAALKRMKPQLIDFTDIVHGQQRMLRFKKTGCEHALALMVG